MSDKVSWLRVCGPARAAPARGADVLVYRPDVLVQGGDGLGVEQEDLAVARVEGCGAFPDGAIHEGAARGANRRTQRPPAAQQRAMHALR